MKRWILSFSLILAVVSVFATSAFAAGNTVSGDLGENCTWIFDAQSGALTLSGKGEIEDQYRAPWESYSDLITSVVVEEGITALGQSTLNNLHWCESVSLPDSLETIKGHAFFGLHSLTEINIPKNVSSIADGFCANCGCAVYHVAEENRSYKITDGALLSYDGTLLVKAPNDKYFMQKAGMTSWEQYSPVDYAVPLGVTHIAESAFEFNDGRFVGRMGGYTEYGPIFKSITVSEGVKSIAENNFIGFECPISLPNSLEECKIPSDQIKNSICTAYDNALYLGNKDNPYVVLVKGTDDSITSLTVHPKTKVICPRAFYYTEYDENEMCEVDRRWTALKNVNLPEGLIYIGDASFAECRNLQTVVIPNTVKVVDHFAFYNCYLKSLTVPCTIESISDIYYQEEEFATLDTLILSAGYGENRGIVSTAFSSFVREYTPKTLVLKEGITSIAERAFERCESLQGVTFPKSLLEIGDCAFWYCSSLSSLRFYEGLQSIGYGAFYGTAITSLTIPNSVKRMGSSAFSECISLTYLTIGTNFTDFEGNVFEDTNIKKVNFTYTNGGLKTIPEGVLSDCKTLTTVNIPKGMVAIGNNAFCRCDSLRSVEIPTSVTSLGWSCFGDCKKLNAVMAGLDIDDSYLWEYNSACLPFSGSPVSIVTVIPDSTHTDLSVSYLNNLFANEYNYNDYSHTNTIKQISLADGITTVKTYAFYGLDELEVVSIPKSVVIIESQVFADCPSLTDIYYAGSNVSWLLTCHSSNNSYLNRVKIHYGIKAPTYDSSNIDTLSLKHSTIRVGDSTSAILNIATPTKCVTWSSNNRSVATVDSNGNVVGVGIGSAKITATLSTKVSVSCTVNVVDRDLQSYKDLYAYSFLNTYDSFGYDASYRIPMERYLQAGHGLNAAWFYYDVMSTRWGGSCHGMSASSILFYTNVLQEEYYDRLVQYPIEFEAPNSYSDKDTLLRNMIELFQVVQSPFNTGTTHWAFNLERAQSIANELDRGYPVLLNIRCNAGGHSVVIYDYTVDDGIYTFDIYDCSGYVRQLICNSSALDFRSAFVYDNDRYSFSVQGYETYSDLKNEYNLMKNNILYPNSFLSPTMKLMSVNSSVVISTLYITLPCDAVITNSNNQTLMLFDGELIGDIENATVNLSDISSDELIYYLTLPADTYSITLLGYSDGRMNIFNGEDSISAVLSGIQSIRFDSSLSLLKLMPAYSSPLEMIYHPANVEAYDAVQIIAEADATTAFDFQDPNSIKVTGADTVCANLSLSNICTSVFSDNINGATVTIRISEAVGSNAVVICSDAEQLSEEEPLPQKRKAEMPLVSVESGSYDEAQTLAFSKDDDTVLYFTIDGSTPTAAHGTLYGNPITISKSMTVKAVAVKRGFLESDVLELNYDIPAIGAPSTSLENRTLNDPAYISLSSDEDAVDILFTTDGSDPYRYGIRYVCPIFVDHNCVVRAVCSKNGCFSNEVAWEYQVQPTSTLYVINTPTNQNGDAISQDTMQDTTGIWLNIKNYSNASVDCTCLLAFYDSDARMLKVATKNVSMSSEENMVYIETGTMPETTDQVKVFFVNKNYIPIGKDYVYSLSEAPDSL